MKNEKIPESIKVSGTNNDEFFFISENRTRKGVEYQLLKANNSGVQEVKDVSRIKEKVLPIYVKLLSSFICVNKWIEVKTLI